MRLLLFFALSSCAYAHKFLAYSPQFAKSHVNFMGKISDILVDAGHEVVMLSEIIDSTLGGPGTKKARVIEIPQTASGLVIEEYMNSEASSNFWNDVPLRETMEAWGATQVLYGQQCRDTTMLPELLERLRAEKFDAAFTESFHYCGPVLFHTLGIDKFAVSESMALIDGWSYYTQMPSNPAYVPANMNAIAGEKMTFLERLYNTYVSSLCAYSTEGDSRTFQAIMNEKYPQLPSVRDLMANNSLVFVNSEPLVDFPRPSSSRIIDIGGIVVTSNPEPLNQTWSDILDLRPQTVFISFGTFAKAHLMPTQYKKTILQVMKRFPNVTFIWKYEKPEDRISAGVENLIESTWVPQRDLLHDPRLSAFITHCGQGSTTESIDAGIPLVVIPILVDQYRNAHQVVRTGTGLLVEKAQLAALEPLENAVREILSNKNYRERAVQVRNMIRERPFPMKDIFVKNMEFLAKHGPLRQLDHYGRNLNFFQYYLIDVIGSVFAVLVLITLAVSVALVKFVNFLLRGIVMKLKAE